MKISVIIPIYNSEKYLGEALGCIINQTLHDIEIICVDDGSTDSSPDILRKYAKQDDRIRIITQENQGAGAARNAGLEVAKGKYLSFLDSDDIFKATMLETAFSEAEKHKADIVVFNADIFDSDTRMPAYSGYILNDDLYPNNTVFSVLSNPDNIFTFTHNVAWNKLFSADLIRKNKITFQNVNTSNDLLFVCSALIEAKNIYCINEVLMSYRKRGDGQLSALHNASKNQWSRLEAFGAVYDYIKSHDCFNAVIQNFTDFSVAHLYHDLRLNELDNDKYFKNLVIGHWLSKLGRQRLNFSDNFEYIIYNEWLSKGFAETYFKNPHIQIPIKYMPHKSPPDGSRVLIYGAAAVGVDTFLTLMNKCKIAAWVDKRYAWFQSYYFPVESLEIIQRTAFDYVIIAVLGENLTWTIRKSLIGWGVDEEKIICPFS